MVEFQLEVWGDSIYCCIYQFIMEGVYIVYVMFVSVFIFCSFYIVIVG